MIFSATVMKYIVVARMLMKHKIPCDCVISVSNALQTVQKGRKSNDNNDNNLKAKVEIDEWKEG